MRRIRPAALGRVALLASLGGSLGAVIGSIAVAGSLSGPVSDEGLYAVVEDRVQLPASSPSRPLARLNVLREVPDGSGRLFVNDLRGPLHVIDGEAVHLYLDLGVLRPLLRNGAGLGLADGFVSFAFHPDFAGNGIFYTVHTEDADVLPPTLGPAITTTISHHCVVTEWTASDPAADAFAGTDREILRIAAPHRFHNAGEIAFDPTVAPGHPDYGLLYIAQGDYGAVAIGEPEQLQRLDTPLGALLRIDPLGGDGSPYSYGIPAGNPFTGDGDPATLDEIYAWGFRNGHRISWSEGPLAAAFVSDIGQANLEEIDRLVAGGNYGWPVREGSYALDPEVDPESVFALPPDDAQNGYRYPVAQYDHDEGDAITGGFVYTARPSSPLYGKFIFGDIASGRIFYADALEMLAADDGDPATTAALYELTLVDSGGVTDLLTLVRAASGSPNAARVDLRFGMDTAGDLYVTTKQDGFVRRLIPEAPVALPGLGPAARWLAAAAVVLAGVFAARGRRAATRRDLRRRTSRS